MLLSGPPKTAARRRSSAGNLSAVVSLLILLAGSQACLALRLPSWGQLLSRRSSSQTAPSEEAVLREVLSSHSTLQPNHAGVSAAQSAARPHLEHQDPALAVTTGAAPAADLAVGVTSLRDPALATVFSSTAAQRLPRLAIGPSLPLKPWPLRQPDDQHELATGSLGGSTTSSGRVGSLGAADPPPPELDPAEALLAGQLASIAYCSHPDLLVAWNCSRCADVPGFVPHRVVYDSVWDLAAYAGYYAPWRAVVLAFRGTDSSNWGQWAENMRAWRTDHMYPVPDFPHALIHAGFYTLWTGSSLQATFVDAVADLLAQHPGSRLVAVGHSMGGALAQLAGLEFKLARNGSAPIHTTVYTFGAPRVGNLAYQQLFNFFIDSSWRFTHNRDIVPSVPLQLMGFNHVAREVWEVDVDDPAAAGGVARKLLLCDASGEDPSCHNSACYLGLCTSIADHLVYLGIHMYMDSDEC